jgi:biopolymer transport protein ExbD
MFADSFGSSFGGGKGRPDEGPAKLNITSMMDMFTIMLIFLLLNFAPDSADLKLDKELSLPTSSSQRPYEVAVKVALTRHELLVGEDVVARIHKGRLVRTKVEDDVIVPLRNLLLKQRSKVENLDKAVVLFYADKDAEFAVVDKVMRTAAVAGYPNFKFAVNGTT